MADLKLSREARADLEAVRQVGIRDHGPIAAEAHLRGFERLFQLLREQPYAGQERPEFDRDICSLAHRPHRILYTVRADRVLIVRVIHHARDVRAVLGTDR